MRLAERDRHSNQSRSVIEVHNKDILHMNRCKTNLKVKCTSRRCRQHAKQMTASRHRVSVVDWSRIFTCHVAETPFWHGAIDASRRLLRVSLVMDCYRSRMKVTRLNLPSDPRDFHAAPVTDIYV